MTPRHFHFKLKLVNSPEENNKLNGFWNSAISSLNQPDFLFFGNRYRIITGYRFDIPKNCFSTVLIIEPHASMRLFV